MKAPMKTGGYSPTFLTTLATLAALAGCGTISTVATVTSATVGAVTTVAGVAVDGVVLVGKGAVKAGGAVVDASSSPSK